MFGADARFARCAAIVTGAAVEGGYTNDPNDPGGPTNHGITLATLSHWRGLACTAEDVQNLTLAEANAIYRALYWAPIAGDSLPAGVDLIAFDSSVNQGPGTAAGFVQAAVGAVVDHHIGPNTLAAIGAKPAAVVITDIAALRLADYEQDQGWAEFGRGWTNRVLSIKAQALAMVGT